jgi:hypothetical protein
MNRLYESHANPGLAVCWAKPAATSGVIPTLRIVSIIPGIENFAPERTEIIRGFLESPKVRPSEFSKSWIAKSNSSIKFCDSVPVFKNSRQA